MSKVKIQGNASGTGIFTVAAPATNTDRTLTLPDVDATVLTTAGGTINGSIGINVAVNTGNTLTLGRVNSASEGGQIDFCRASDNASAWGIDAYGDTSTPSIRIIDNTASATRFQIDSGGRVTTPNQPFFAGTHSNEYGTIYTSGNTIPVSTAFTNTGNHFNTSTYTFTCPVNGVYEAIMTDLSQDGDTAALAIYINGNLTTKAYWQSTRQRFHASMFYASANDAITFRVGEGSCKLYGAGSYGRYQIRLLG